MVLFFIRPESYHCIALPCQYLGNSCITDLIDVTLADEDAFATQKFLMLLLM